MEHRKILSRDILPRNIPSKNIPLRTTLLRNIPLQNIPLPRIILPRNLLYDIMCLNDNMAWKALKFFRLSCSLDDEVQSFTLPKFTNRYLPSKLSSKLRPLRFWFHLVDFPRYFDSKLRLCVSFCDCIILCPRIIKGFVTQLMSRISGWRCTTISSTTAS